MYCFSPIILEAIEIDKRIKRTYDRTQKVRCNTSKSQILFLGACSKPTMWIQRETPESINHPQLKAAKPQPGKE